MTSEANRNHFIEGIRYLAGDDTRVVVGNDVENEDVNIDEYEAIEEIQDKIGVKVPEFYYRPVGMEFYDYIIDESVALAKIEYEYNGLIIALYIDQQNEEVASDVYAMQGDEQETIVTGDEKTEVTIKRVEDENEEIPNYVASWTKGDVAYTLTGRMNIEEFEKIIKYMKF